jgi:hypothetical protein
LRSTARAHAATKSLPISSEEHYPIEAVNPSLYQLNTKTYLSTIGPQATLDDIPDGFIESLSRRGFDWLWLLGVWRLGPTGRLIALQQRSWLGDQSNLLPDLTDQDIAGSPFAVCSYSVDPSLGGNAALLRARQRFASYGIRLLLDFVPNHIGFDHPWVGTNPEFLINGDEDFLQRDPDTWVRLSDGRVVAFGRDPNFPGWTDTLQLNYSNPALRHAMIAELKHIAMLCDGVRCDMAMLVEPEIFRLTWANRAPSTNHEFSSFWKESINEVRAEYPDFLFLAEVYWDYEYKLQQLGFDYTYDKTLYDRVTALEPQRVREHLTADLEYQSRMARFLENHDEPRIASRLSTDQQLAAAVITYLSPGLRFFHDGQLVGKRFRVPVQLKRAPLEAPDLDIIRLYDKLLPILQSRINRSGTWMLLKNKPAWPENSTYQNFISFLIQHPEGDLLACVNYAATRGQSFVDLGKLSGSVSNFLQFDVDKTVTFTDLLSNDTFERPSRDLVDRGLYLDCQAWQSCVFRVRS